MRLRAIELRAENSPLRKRAESILGQLINALAGPEEIDQLDTRLIEKLSLAGELRPGYLLRALEQKRLGLFTKALARLGGYQAEAVSRAIASSDRPELLALALAGIGIDRGAFQTILEKVRAISGGAPGGGDEGVRRAMGAFAQVSAPVAAEAFRRASEAV